MSEDIKKENPLGDALPETQPGSDCGEAAAAAVEEAAGAAQEAADEVGETAAEEAAGAVEAAAGETGEADESLNEELESLRETFQEKYNETAQAAARGPVIQELEAHSAESEEDAEETEEAVAEAKPAKKKMKKGVKALLAVVIIVVTLVFGLLIAYFVMSVTNPNFNSLVGSLMTASAAESYDEKKAAYEEALSYCDGEASTQVAMKDYIVDEILKAAYEEKGFSEASALMRQYLTEEQIASSKSKTVKTVKKVIAAVDEIADGSLEAVFDALKENPSTDAQTVAGRFSVPTEVAETVLTAFEDEINGVKTLQEHLGVTGSDTAITYLQSAYSVFTGAGADSRDLGEKMAVALYRNGYVFAAMTISNALGEAEEGNLNQDYTDMLEELGNLSGLSESLYDLAAEAVRGGRTDYAALTAEKTGLDEKKAALLGELVSFCADGIRSENEKNFSLASSAFVNTNSVAQKLGMTDAKLIYHAANALVASGNLGELNTYDVLLTDEVSAALTEAEAGQVERFHQIFSALSSASEVFTEYYSSYAYYGQPIDYEAACAALDALITADSNKYDRGFASYCKYFAALYSDNTADLRQHVEDIKAVMPDLKTVYGYYLIALDKDDGNYASALATAEDILSVNVGDDYANATVAFVKRTQGDLEGALETALTGIALSGSETFCGNEAAVDYMLTGDFDSAFSYLKKMYQDSMSIETCDMLLIFNALYEGDDREIKDELASLTDEINQMYQSYGVSSLSDTEAVISGEKTLADVFLAGSYALSGDGAQTEETAE